MTSTTANVTGSEMRRSDSPAQGQAAAPASPASHAPPGPVPYLAAPRKPYVPLRERINLRMVLFFLAVSAIPLALAYSAIDFWINQGVNRSGDYLVVDLKALGSYPFDQQDGKLEDVPQRYRELDGKKVKLQGFMWGHKSAGDRGREFQFVYNVTACCFNGPPQVQERVYAYTRGKSLRLFPQYQFAEITGVLHVRIVRDKDTGAIYSVYDLDVETTQALDA
jgi:hypothetical protein